jgi:hypothetical protein
MLGQKGADMRSFHGHLLDNPGRANPDRVWPNR